MRGNYIKEFSDVESEEGFLLNLLKPYFW